MAALSGCTASFPTRAWAPYLDPARPLSERVGDLLARMTLEEKVGQMAQVERGYLAKPTEIARYGLGSVLSGGGSAPARNTPEAWAEMIDSYQRAALASRLAIPILYGADAVHGNNNLQGAIIFPHNIGIGAANDPELVWEAARVTARESSAVGIRWTFSPVVAVPQDIRWGRTYEGFGSDPVLVSRLGAAAIEGYQGSPLGGPGRERLPSWALLATAKHFIADGGTSGGVDRGDARIPVSLLRAIHLVPYRAAVGAGVGSVMVSFSSWNGVPDHGNRSLVTGMLKGELGFAGFVVSDWGGVALLPGDSAAQIRTAIDAGIDMVMIPDRYPTFIATVLDLVRRGELSESRIDDAVRRILAAKFRLGLFEHPFAERSLIPEIGSPAHRAVARRAVRESIVLLKNEGHLLPLSGRFTRIVVAGRKADDIGAQCGGWTISWQGMRGAITEGTSILEGIRRAAGSRATVLFSPDGHDAGFAQVGIVVVGEEPYAEGQGDRTELALSAEDRAAIAAVKDRGIPVIVVLVSGRPLIVTGEISGWDAALAAWLPGSEGEGVADLLLGRFRPTGRLPCPWPRTLSQIPFGTGEGAPLFPAGYGLSY